MRPGGVHRQEQSTVETVKIGGVESPRRSSGRPAGGGGRLVDVPADRIARWLQGRQALEAAADTAAEVLLPHLPRLEAVVLGGDRRAIDGLRKDRRLAALFRLAVDRFLALPDPKLAILRRTPALFRAVQVRLL